MIRFDAALRRLPVLLLLAIGGCEGDTAELVQEINAAREGCTEEKLRAGDEECVRMMERYAEMGTEAMQTYIGAVKSLDQALRRMPPVQFDTAGLGHAISPGDPAASGGGLLPAAPSFSRGSAARAWESDPYPDGAAYDPARPGGAAPWGYGAESRFEDPEAPGEPYPEAYREEYPARPRGYDPRDPGAPDERAWRGSDAPRGRAPRAEPQARGRMLPPEQRLRRPWLDAPQEPRTNRAPAPRRAPRMQWPDTAGTA